MSAAPEPVIVGRDTEHRVVRDALKALSARRSTTIEITGEAGIGKTSLVDAAARLAEAQGTVVVRGRASQLETDVPYGLWHEALGDAFPSADPSTPELRHRLHRRLRATVAERSTGRGVLVALDDLHWADSASIDLIASIVERGLDVPAVLLLSHRPHQTGSQLRSERLRAAPRHALRTIALQPLPVETLGALLPPGLDEVQRTRIAESCGGNPLLLRALLDRGVEVVPDPARGVRADPRLSGGPISEPIVRAAIASELAPLSEPARELLGAAAVAGDPFSLDIAEAIAGIRGETAGAAFDEIVAADLVRPAAARRWLRFRHPLLHAAVLDGLSASRRAAAHARAAEVLGEAGVDATLLAPHVERAARVGDEAAIAVLHEAARSVKGRAPASAAHWLVAAWALVPAGERREWPALALFTDTTTALSVAGRLEEARDMLIEMLGALPPEHPARLPTLIGCALVERFANRSRSARMRLTGALRAAAPGPSWERALLLVELGMLEASEDDPAQLAVHADALLSCAAALGIAPLAATAHAFDALAAAVLEPAAVAAARVVQAFEAVEGLEDQIMPAAVRAAVVTAEAAVLMRRFDLAEPLLERAMLASQDGAVPIAATESMAGLALVLAARGRGRLALQTAEAALEEARLMTNDQSLVVAQLALSVVLELSGDPHRAVVAAQQAELHAERTGTQMARSFVGQALGRALLAAERPQEAAEALLRTHGGESLALTPPSLKAESCALLASTALQASGPDAACPWVQRAREAAAAGYAGDDAFVWLATAEVSIARGEHGAAQRDAELAAAAAERAGLPILAGRATATAGRARALAGDRDGAAVALREAEATFVRCGADRLAAGVVRDLRSIGRRVSRRGRAGATAGPGVLTARQRQVVELAVNGLSNREIAEQLVLSPKTIETHLAAAFTTLGVASRTALAAALAAGER